ncbi:hypothetical protein VE04_07263 [Pseudogymnoascus sp. 24MN13]|nr:hypothetical protein VE04_07263 [Pseudogymnoascus sp. 24MN13]
MSFGYSIGDFIAGANLSYKLFKALSSSRGATQEYQEAVMEIGAMHQAFLQVGRMTSNPTVSHATINAASCIVLSSMSIIDDFLERTKRYRERLCGRTQGNMLSDSWQKMGWALFGKEELKALKDALHTKLSSISVLLATAQFHEQMPSAVSQYQVMSPSLPLKSSPPPRSDPQHQVRPPSLPSIPSSLPPFDSQLEPPGPLPNTRDMDEKDDGIEARFAKLEEFMNQRHTKEPANSLEAEDIESTAAKHSDKEDKDASKDAKAGSEPYKEVSIISQFEKLLKAQQQKGLQDSDLLIDLERMLMRVEGGKQKPLKFTDAVGRKFWFPFHLARTWQGMEDLITQAFLHVDVIGPHVQEGHYDLIGPNGEIILPQVWETLIESDMAITMHMWPEPEPEPEPEPA